MASFARQPDHTIFFVGEDAAHHHIVCENHGVIGGDFASREAAIRFAQRAASRVPGALVMIAPKLVEVTRHAD